MIHVVTEMTLRRADEEGRARPSDLAADEDLVLDYIRPHVKQAKEPLPSRATRSPQTADYRPDMLTARNDTCTTG